MCVKDEFYIHVQEVVHATFMDILEFSNFVTKLIEIGINHKKRPVGKSDWVDNLVNSDSSTRGSIEDIIALLAPGPALIISRGRSKQVLHY